MPTDFRSFLNQIGQNLKAFRQRSGLTQNQLANQAGVARITLARLELGQANITLNTLFLLGKAMNISPDAFLNGSDTIHISKSDIMQEGWQNLIQRIVND